MGGTHSPLGGNTFPPSDGDAFGHLTCGEDGQRQATKGGTQSPPTPPLTTPSTPAAPHDEDSPAPLTPVGGGQQQQNDDLADAAAFLEQLPHPWTIGPVTAKAMAPDLLQAIDSQGWDLDDELTAKLTENPDGIRSYPPILRRRIGDLPKRIRKPPHVPSQLPPWCGECADGNRVAAQQGHLRKLYDANGNGRPCPKCHPTQTSHAA